MKKINRLGIWMDHVSANLFNLSNDSIEHKTIVSAFTHENKQDSLKRSEQLMHNKEQHQQNEYYKEIGQEIKLYDEVILFGPTTAKAELHNLLNADHQFNHIKIACKQAGKLTPKEQQSYAKEYFALS